MPPKHSRQTSRLGVAILAAGASSRMGEPKMLLPWGKTTVIGHLIAQWQNVGAGQIAIVTAAGDQALAKELERLAFPSENRICNPAPEHGMFSSIQCAARWSGWTPELSHWVIALGDQPHLRVETLLALLGLGAAHPEAVCQLSRKGRPRHPVLLPAQAFQSLGVSTHESLKQFLHSAAVEFALEESEDAGLDLDMDEPADYVKAVRLSSQTSDTEARGVS